MALRPSPGNTGLLEGLHLWQVTRGIVKVRRVVARSLAVNSGFLHGHPVALSPQCPHVDNGLWPSSHTTAEAQSLVHCWAGVRDTALVLDSVVLPCPDSGPGTQRPCL